MEKTNKVIISILSLLLVVAIFAIAGFANKPAEIRYVNNTIVKEVSDNATLAEIAALKEQIASLDEFEVEADEKLQNDTAKDLVNAEIATKDFKNKILSVLEDEGYSVEDYKNITIYSSKINDVELSDDSAEVEMTIKVSSFNDGDEEDSFKVKLSVNFLVSGLDVDDMEDAEVEDDDTEIEFVMEYD